MTEFVTCKVCGCQAPLGGLECPDCGAPLPTEVEVLAQTAVEGEAVLSPDADGPVTDTPAKKKRRFVPVVAGVLVLCLLVSAVVLMLPKKEPPAGIMFMGDSFVTPDGVWDFWEAGFYHMDSTSDGRYVLLREWGEGVDSSGASDWIWYGAISSLSSSIHTPTGDYFLFDGRTLERTDWETVHLMEDGTVFYSRKEDVGTSLYRRDLNRGKTAQIDRFVGEGYLDHFVYASDGSAVVYRWTRDGADEPEEYRLWRKGSKLPISLDITGEIYGVGEGGMTCLFWKDRVRSAYFNGSDSSLSSVWYPACSLWQNGEVVDLPSDMQVSWSNTTYTQFILQKTREDYSRGWYYYAPGETDQPVLLDVSEESYLTPAGLWVELKSLKDQFYHVYDSGADKLCYLTDDMTLLTVEERGVNSITLSEDGKTGLYLKNGELCRASMDDNGTMEVVALTNTAQVDPASSLFVGAKRGTVAQFTASEDLEHIYYTAQEYGYPIKMTLHHWHNGEDRALDFGIDGYYDSLAITVTDRGGCYFTFVRNVYYTEGDRPPELVMENAGTYARVQLVGEAKWPLLEGTQWKDGQDRGAYWRLDGNNIPVELEEWYPKEGTI